MASPHINYSFSISYNVKLYRVVLTIVSRVVLELFQPQRVPGRLRLQLVRSREAEQRAVEAEEEEEKEEEKEEEEEEKEEEKEEEEEEEHRGGGTTEAEAAPEQPGRAPASLASLAELENVATHKIFAMYLLNWSQIRLLGLCIQVSETMSKN